MLAAPPLLLLLSLSLLSACSTLALLLLPLLARFSPWKLLNPSRPLPRSFYPSLPPRPTPCPSPGALTARKIAVCLAAVDLGVLVLGLWQGLLLWSRSNVGAAGTAISDDIGEGVRMGLALVLRQVAWCAVLAYLLADARTSSATTPPDRVAYQARRTAFVSLCAAALVVVLFAALFAGVASVNLSAVYGVALAADLALMMAATAVASSILFSAARGVQPLVAARIDQEVQDKSSDSRRPLGWAETASWISSPAQSVVTLPPFNLSLPRNSQYDHLLRTPTPSSDGTQSLASRPKSWLTSPSRSASSLPEWSFDTSEVSHHFADRTLASWISEPSGTQPTMSPYSYPSTTAPISPLTAGSDPFAATPAVSRASIGPVRGHPGTPLSPPPACPLPPTPPSSSESHAAATIYDPTRPSTSSCWTTTTMTATAHGQTVRIPSAYTVLGDTHYQAYPVPGTATTTTSVQGRAADREKAFSSIDLSGRALTTQTVRMARKDVALFGSMIGTAWIVFALALPTVIDSLTRPTTLSSPATAITFLLSLIISSPFCLLFTLLLRTSAFESALRRIQGDLRRAMLAAGDGAHLVTAKPAIIVQRSTPLKTATLAKRKSELRPLHLVDALATNRSSTSLSSAASGSGFMQGRCLSPNEEGHLADFWHENGHISRPTSRLSRVVSLLSPHPTLQQQLPTHSPSELVFPHASRRPASARAPSPAPSVASSLGLNLLASRPGDEAGQQTVDDDQLDRSHSFLDSALKATVSTAQRATRVSGDMARLVYLPPSPTAFDTGEFGAGLDVKDKERTKSSSYSIDALTAGLLPQLVPTIRIGKAIEVTHDGQSTLTHSAAGTASNSLINMAGSVAQSVIRRLSSYDKEQLPFQRQPADTPRSTIAHPRSGAQAPTPSHGRSTSVEMRSDSFLTRFFDSPSVVASTPSRLTRSARQRCRPSGDFRPRYKAYMSLPAIHALDIDETWSAEVLDESGRLATDGPPIALGDLSLPLGDSFAAPGGKRTFGEPESSTGHLCDVVEEDVQDDKLAADDRQSSSGRSTPVSTTTPSGQPDASDEETPIARRSKGTFGPVPSENHYEALGVRVFEHNSSGLEAARPVSQASSAFSDATDLGEKLAQLQAELAGSSTVDDVDYEIQDGTLDEVRQGGQQPSQSGQPLVVEEPTPPCSPVSLRSAEMPDTGTGSPHSEYRMPLRLHRSASLASALTVASTASGGSEAFSYHSPTPLPRAGLGHVGCIKGQLKAPLEQSIPQRAPSSLSAYRPGSSASQYSGAVRPETAQSSYSRPGSRQDVLGQSRQMNAVVEERPDDNTNVKPVAHAHRPRKAGPSGPLAVSSKPRLLR